MYVCPAGHHPNRADLPVEWVDNDNKPVTFQVEFTYGTAEVDDALGKYMLAERMVERSRLIVPGYFGGEE